MLAEVIAIDVEIQDYLMLKLVGLIVFNATFSYPVLVYRGGQFYW